ncbi:protein SUPPRESSOR OF GENE SILENCING 3-like protein [Gossypium australe]|uniref:Protein SUPPRESSOR OF GENE SILENCING 3-like protein n=1 Tax=Gossypium australe TaxID=47621 RepID=A0A5B6X8B9_9ROSI|nr:protein SUPPRESSOR OF GENE SILENCING 3-like protein [Gossypium australe]
MNNELAFDLLYGAGDEKDIFELSYATFAEELQLQVILKESMMGSEKELEDAASEAIKKPECVDSHGLSNTECTISHVSGIHKPRSFNKQEPARWRTQQRFGYVEQQRINWDDNGRDRFKWRKPTGWHDIRGRRVGDVPQTSSSNEFHAKTSSWGEGSPLVGTGNPEDPKGKGITIDDGWLLISKWNSESRGGNSADKQRVDLGHPNHLKGSKDDDTNAVHEDDCESLDDEDDFDSDDSQKSHESRKKSKWFKEFFERMDALNAEEIDQTMWHCPACQGGPGAIKWYRSISDLIAHSKKIGSRRVKLHQEFAMLLEGELCIRGTSVSPPSDPIVGTWKGLKEDARDHQVVWPPMVVIMNTMTSNSKDGKFVGMGSQELLEHFSSFPALKAQHSYGPQGHRGLSVLIFESSAVGYLEAERLHQNFLDQRLDRFAWNSCTNEVLPGGERQLYGFMAVKEDLDCFNQHCQEAVLNEIKKMTEDSQQLIRLKDKLEEEKKRAKTLERSVNDLSRNLQQRMKDICIFERRVKSLHEDNKEEVESQEIFYKDQIKILEARVKELDHKLKESGASPLHTGEPEPAMSGLLEEEHTYTPYQYNSNLGINEDSSLENGKLPSKSNEKED